ncbi:MAG: MATE family efflux transporter [Saprospiraceae bacterium]|nr:MATE family efflux transporter [Saprospiraceae bacterium]
MKLNTSYQQIFSLSFPIMLGSAAQNIIVLSDNVFLYHYNHLDFAAAGLVGVFYLIISSIGYGFSRGGQIIIARRHGEQNFERAGTDFQALIILELALSVLLFFLLRWFSRPFFELFVVNQEILDKCLAYLEPRSWGIFFSYMGVSLIAFYSGIARPKFIMIDTMVLIVVNLILNYVFVFGKFGFAPMGIAGSALASTVAEAVAFIVFVLYMFWDKANRMFGLLSLHRLSGADFYNMFSISIPGVFQSFIGIGSWFLFFSFMENVGSKELEISNLLRTIYLILSIPCWGYSSGINTLVSHFIGNRKRQAVLPMIIKTIKLNLLTTMLLAMPVLMFPEFFLYPLFGSQDMSLILISKPYMPVLFLILMIFSMGGILINGLIGTGYTMKALWIQVVFTFIYMVYCTLTIKVWYQGIGWAWAAEIFYWLGISFVSYQYLKSNKWYIFKF